MIKNLLIVESPAKAKTIEKYLGQDFTVKASYGHIRDLPKDDQAVDTKNGFTPRYEIPADKQKVVVELRKLAKEAQAVWLATDEDREGEAISWHLAEALNLPIKSTKRIVFHEITKNAILEAVSKPRFIDMDLVNAQQARRVLDRLVGYELSPVLWRKVKTGLSAGRVQSVAVRLIVDREREIAAFNSNPFFRVTADFNTPEGKMLKAELSQKLTDEAAARKFLETCAKAKFQVRSLEVKPAKRTPAPPFTTSTLQQEAARKLGYSVANTMRLAQSLYEAGHITYMRTDSVNLGQGALAAAKDAIVSDFGDKYHQRRTYQTKSANAQEAHEAIRPTDFRARTIAGDRSEMRLYELIWKRTVASQMADAQLERTVVTIDVQAADSSKQPHFTATGEIIIFDGFLKLYLESAGDDSDDTNDGDDNGILPRVKQGDALTRQRIVATERYTRPPARYSEAGLVKDMEELGIGRPSTYAPTISTIQNRNYVVKESREGKQRPYRILTLTPEALTEKTASEITGAEKNKLFPTDLGALVTDFLLSNFAEVVDFKFTARVEEEFDQISRGEIEWHQMLQAFYDPFHALVKQTAQLAERASGERLLGNDPATGKPIIARMGRFGSLVQIGASDDPDKRFANLQANQRLETITFEEAIRLFDLPRVVGQYEGSDIKANVGRFGPYVQHASKFYSLPKGVEPISVSLEHAIEIIEAKRKADSEKLIKRFDEQDIEVLNGRWGPYVVVEKTNVKIPKEYKDKPAEVTLEQCLQWFTEQGGAKPAKAGRWGKKAAAPAAEAKPKANARSGAKRAVKTTGGADAAAAVAKPKAAPKPKTPKAAGAAKAAPKRTKKVE